MPDKPPLLSVVVPIYNEVNTLQEIVRRVQETPYDKEIILVDDASTDGTGEVLEGLRASNVRVLRHERNQGKGAALRTAFEDLRGEITLIQDADLEYSPSDYPTLLQPILDARADVVYGSRFLGGPHRVLFFWHQIGNTLVTLLSNMLTNLNLTDMETGYKVMRTEIARKLDLRSRRFGVEPEITAKLAKMRVRIYETPISYSGRDYSEGKKITWRDGLAAVWHIIRFHFTA